MKKRKIDKILFGITKFFSIFVNGFYDIWTGGKKRNVFYDIDKHCPELKLFEENYEVIKKEFESVFAIKDQLPTYNELDSNQNYIAGANKHLKWNVQMLNLFGYKPKGAQALCPETLRQLDKVPNLFQAFFSILEPGKSVPAHSGAYRGYLRYHLGLKVPSQNPPKIRVKDQFHTWEEKKTVLFDDTWDHEVINNSNEARAVLIIDILRPMPLLPHLVNKMIAKAVKHTYGKQVMKRLERYS